MIHAAHRVTQETWFEVADSDGERLGYLKVSPTAGKPWVRALWVKAGHRNGRVALALAQAALAAFGDQDLYAMVQPFTDAPMDEDRLTRLYAHFGFQPTAVPGIMMRPATKGTH
jgi:hypothetical protein